MTRYTYFILPKIIDDFFSMFYQILWIVPNFLFITPVWSYYYYFRVFAKLTDTAINFCVYGIDRLKINYKNCDE